MMNLVPNSEGRTSARHRQVSGPAPMAAMRNAAKRKAGTAPQVVPPTAGAVRLQTPAAGAAEGGSPSTEPSIDDSTSSDEHDSATATAPSAMPRLLDPAPHTSAVGDGDQLQDPRLADVDQPIEPKPGGRRTRPALSVLVGAPTLVAVVLAALISLYARAENAATERVASRIDSAQHQYRAAADADRAVSRARVAATQGIVIASQPSLAQADVALRLQSDTLDDISQRVEAIAGNNRFTEPLAALLASDRAYLDQARRVTRLAQSNPDAARASLSSDQESYAQRLTEHDALSRDLSSELDRLTGELENQRRNDRIVFPVLPIALAIVGFALSWWAWRSIIEPLRHVSRTLEQVADGQFRVRANLVANDDLGRVGHATDRLARRLGNRFSTLSDDARRNTQNRVISESLEIADSEVATLAVVEQALGLFAPGLPGELLFIETESGKLGEVATSPSSGSPGCSVTDPADCVALRRGQSTVFDSSDSINSCPMLRHRPGGPVSALCVPMTFNSSPLGVIHLTGPSHRPPDGATSDQFVALGSQTATRIGALRTLEVTRRQASTDGLTGLANRQVIEASVAQLLTQRTPFVVVLADLDRFKAINDRFGHEAGDGALRAFADVASHNVRSADVVGRLGGDEFIIIYPELTVEAAVEAIERLRIALGEAVTAGRIIAFTASFGLARSTADSNFTDLVRRADAGLLLAKERGRDRAIVASPELVRQVFPARDALPDQHS